MLPRRENAQQPATKDHAFAVERDADAGRRRQEMVLRRRPAWMRGSASMFVVAILLSVAGVCDGAADPSIAVQGNRRIDADAIRAHIHTPRSGELDMAALDTALKELYATGAFEDVKIARSGAQVVVTVVEAPVIGRLQFEGNKKFKDADLAKVTARRWPRRLGVRDRRGRQDRRQADRLHRQPCVCHVAPAGHHHHDGVRLVRVPQDQRYL
jgi:hypothetical protein